MPDRLENSKALDLNAPNREVDPTQGGEFNRFEAAPRISPLENLGHVEALDRFGKGILTRVADASDGRRDARLG